MLIVHHTSRTTYSTHASRRGFTLIELLVSIALFSIIVSIAAGGFVNALRAQRAAAAMMAAQSNVSIALEEMAREIRTGYLFCHDIDHGTNASYATLPICGCTVTQTSAGPVASCSGLEYYNASGEKIDYTIQNGALYRSDSAENNGNPQAITGSNVSIQHLTFTVFGNIEGDHWNPRITIAIGVAPNDPTFNWTTDNLQTTISARSIDCTEGGSC
jgi:prepilin-type N-terminal cleavage/methylation domain-containing protein